MTVASAIMQRFARLPSRMQVWTKPGQQRMSPPSLRQYRRARAPGSSSSAVRVYKQQLGKRQNGRWIKREVAFESLRHLSAYRRAFRELRSNSEGCEAMKKILFGLAFALAAVEPAL